MKRRNLFCRIILGAIVIISAVTLSGCGKVESAKSLYSKAKREHGSCTIVSKIEEEEKTIVVLHDELQDFDYEVGSVMRSLSIDGASFGKYPDSYDHFMYSLIHKVFDDKKARFDEICGEKDAHYELDGDMYIFAPDAETAERLSLECAKIIGEENLEARLDGFTVSACGNEFEERWDNEHYGSVVLPDIKWLTPEDELIIYYTEMARMQTDSEAVFLRMEKGTFRDTGADLDRVVSVLGMDYPEAMDDEVTFYYFRSSKGKEYFLCDFNYYIDENYHDMRWYTNYSE